MIARMWRGQAKAATADAYEHFVTTRVFTALPAIEGHRGAWLLKRAVSDQDGEGAVEFIAVTLWESLVAIRGFAGAEIDRAVVEPEARAILSTFDDVVRHFELAHGAPCA